MNIETVSPLETVILTNGSLQVSITPQANMIVTSIKKHGKEILAEREGLNGYIKDQKSFALPLLAPWANRLASNTYHVDGQQISFNPNGMKLDENGYPIHGLLTASKNWTTETITHKNSVTLQGTYRYDEKTPNFEAYPFPHIITVAYTLANEAFTVTTTITNTGNKTLPIAYGYHPYFLTERHNVHIYGQYETIPLNTHNLPKASGEENENPELEMLKLEPNWKTAINTPAGWITMETSNYPYMLIWAPTNTHFVAIEPMTANIDPFNNNPTLLKPNNKHNTVFRLKF